MAGQKTTSIVSDYNTIQTKISNVLGVGSSDYGYGQPVTSAQITSKTLISNNIWNNLRNDMLRARQHQTGVDESSNLPLIVKGTLVTETQRSTYDTYANTIVNNRLVTPPISQATRENVVVGTRTTSWNSTLTHSVTITFDSVDAARYYFNTGSTFEFSANRTGGTSGLKNTSWSTLLTNMGTISFKRSTTTNTGSGTAQNIGYSNLTSSDQMIFQKLTETPIYSPNQYDVYAKFGTSAAQIIFTISFSDLSGGTLDENVDGTLTSTVQAYRATGSNVTVWLPSSTGTFTGGTTVAAPPVQPPAPTYSIEPDTTSIGEGLDQLGWFTVTTTNVDPGTTLYWTTSGSNIMPEDFTDNTLSGFVVIDNANTGRFRRVAAADHRSEGTETFVIQLRTGSITGPVVKESKQVSILDLSQDTTPTYNIGPPSVTNINEDGTTAVTFTITTTNSIGTTLYWTTSGTGITPSDFTDGKVQDSFVVDNTQQYTLTRIAKADKLTEGPESFQIQLRTGSFTGPVQKTSTAVTINDTSTNPNPTYTLTATPVSINETTNNTFSITLTTSSVDIGTTLYYTFGGSATYGTDYTVISGPSLSGSSGSFVTTGSTMTWNFQVIADNLTEGSETVFFQIKETSGGTVVSQSPTVTIADTSTNPTYTFTVNQTSINETSNRTFAISLTTTSVDIGTTLYYTFGGTATYGTDYTVTSGPSLSGSSGSFVTTGSTMTWNFQVNADNLTEGDETVFLQIKETSGGTVVKQSPTVTIADTSAPQSVPGATYNISEPNVTIISEDGTTAVTFTITTTNSIGTTLYWTTSGTGITTSDFTDGKVQDSFVVDNTQQYTLTRIAKADKFTEGPELFQIQLRTGSFTGPVVKTSTTVAIADTSTNPAYTFTVNQTSINETSNRTFAISLTTTSVDIGTTLYYTFGGTATYGTDYTVTSGPSLSGSSGSFVTTGSTMTWNFQVNADNLTEGDETVFLQIKETSGGTVVKQSPTVTISDTSTNPTYTLTANQLSSNETTNNTFSFSLTTTNVDIGTTLYYTFGGSATYGTDYTVISGPSLSGSSGSFVTTGSTMTWNFQVNADNLKEGDETVFLQIKETSGGTVKQQSPTVTIADTSAPLPDATYKIEQSSSIISENGTTGVEFTITTTNSIGKTLYWTTTRTTGIDSSDFTDGKLQDSFVVPVNGIYTLTRIAKADKFTEGSESFQIQLRTDSFTGPVVQTSAAGGVLILDTSLNAAYTLTATPVSINETTTKTFSITLTTTSVDIGTTLYCTFGGTATYGTDYTVTSGPSLTMSGSSGSFVTTGSSMTWNFEVSSDTLTEGSETVFLQIKETSGGTVKQQSPTVTIADTSLSPVYSLALDKTTVNETASRTFTLTLTTTNFVSGAILYMGVGGTAFFNTDYTIISGPTINTTTGMLTVNSAVMTWTFQVVTDNLTEGSETVSFSLHTGSLSGTTVATTPVAVTITDTSLNIPTGNLSVSPSPTVDEGNLITVTFTNSDFAIGTILYTKGVWVTGTNSGDFAYVSGQAIAADGGFPITSATMTWTFRVVADQLTEGPESMYWEVHTGSISGPLLCTSNTLTVNDTSTTQHGTTTFNTIGTWTVPIGITTVSVTALGGGGGPGGNDSYNGSDGVGGTIVTDNISVTPGQILSISVGGPGGPGESSKAAGAGGSAGSGLISGGIGGRSGSSGFSGCGGGGGGASCVLSGSSYLIVAAGGGGGAGGGKNSAGHTAWDFYLSSHPDWYQNATSSKGADGRQGSANNTSLSYDGAGGGGGGGGYPLGGNSGAAGGSDNGGTNGQSGQSLGTVTGTGTNFGLNSTKLAGGPGYVTLTW